ncbi:hypothetical protein [Rossellomorea aquimaris]|uniref:hypothetical protein n=1 Tax=Rossellomorea aquimaris TaxID=189382 RepID=UPI001CFCD14A|nr:hypothetical protein [Rossellomorea aquimaris]
MKKVGVITLFILICAGTSLALVEVLDETTDKIKGFYFVEDTGGESNLSLGPGKEGRTISEGRLDEPFVVEEPLPWFEDPFFGKDGGSKGLLWVAKKYGVFVVLAAACLFWYLRRKKKKERIVDVPETTRNPYTVHPDQLEPREDRSITLSEEKLNEIRQMVQDWDSRLTIINRKRHHETIQEWFKRINGPAEIIPVYEKVRYGGKSFTHKELLLLKKCLK